jgi:16S rRNA (cytidine1402-2'-O)-methyltransferase
MAKLYLIPSLLHEEGMQAIPAYILETVKSCQEFFVENERTARRFLKKLSKEIVIDDYGWHTIKDDADTVEAFRQAVKAGKTIGILSEAGCPGVADPGQKLVAIAQSLDAEIHPLTGPNSILLALMASGLNGQQFQFRGYLPIENPQRIKAIKELEAAAIYATQIFIETPYRNNQLVEAIVKNCKPGTLLCIAVDLTGPQEWVKTKAIKDWQHNLPDIHKRPAIFLLG